VNLWPVFISGLTIGGISCLAVQGGLLASVIAAKEDEDTKEDGVKKHNLWPTAAFLTTKFIVYTALGFLLGAFGQVLALSDTVRIAMQLVAGLYMVTIALNLLNVHPIFRYAVIQPPRFLTRLVKNQSKSKDLFAPAFLGAMTIFIPCGTTLAMEALAVSSGSPLLGASIMATFTIATIPLFFGLGFLTTTLGDALKNKFYKVAALLVLYLGITSVNGSLVASGSSVTIQSIADKFPIKLEKALASKNGNLAKLNSAGEQAVEINVLPNGYSPNRFTVRAGSPVALYLNVADKLGCTSAFRIPSLGINKNLTPSFTDSSIKFTPQAPGSIAFTCSMGMYRGVIEVI